MISDMLHKANLLFFVIVLAFFLRYYGLSNVPPSASLDEVSIGYNAYSILQTGRDEYGTQFPILLRAYDDWRPALYAYLVIPFIKLLGLNVLAVRLPSVIFSVLTIIATYFLTCELIRISRVRINANTIGLVSSFLLAISPWHVYISRLGHEVNVGLSFVVFAILFFIKAINNIKKRIFIFLSIIFFGLSLYTYQSEKVFVPLIILLLVFVYRDSLLKMKKEVVIPVVLGIILIIPLITSTLTPQGLIRFRGTSAFTQESFYKESANKVLKYKNEGNTLGQIINNRRLVPLKIFTANYFSHFNPKWLFTNLSSEPFKAPNVGLLNLWEAPLIVVGIFVLIFSKYIDPKNKKLIFLWFLLAPIPASIATQAPHAMRFYNVLPTWQIFSALGLVYLLYRLGKYRVLILSVFSFAVFISLSSFYNNYFIVFPKEQSSSFQYALSKTIPYVLSKEKYYQKIVFSNYENLYQSYMFYLFYSKYDPYLYQKQGGTKSGGFEESHKFGKYEFRPIVWSKDKLMQNTLFVGNAQDFPNSINVLASFANLDERGAIKVVQNQ